jgi:hypothetical protein
VSREKWATTYTIFRLDCGSEVLLEYRLKYDRASRAGTYLKLTLFGLNLSEL